MFTNHKLPIVGGLLAATAIALASPLDSRATGAGAEGPQLAHMVYFKLKDSSGASRAKLVAACKLYLAGHEGAVSFATGTLSGDGSHQLDMTRMILNDPPHPKAITFTGGRFLFDDHRDMPDHTAPHGSVVRYLLANCPKSATSTRPSPL